MIKFSNGKLPAKRLGLVVLSGVLSLTLSGCFLFPKEEEALAPPLKEPAKVTYETEPVKRGTIEKVTGGTARFVSVYKKDYYFKIGGSRLKKINVTIGDKVKKGDVLAELETDDLESRIRQKKLDVDKAQLAYDKLKSSRENGKELPDIEINRLQIADLQRQLDRYREIQKNLEYGVKLQDVYPGVDLDSIESQIQQKKLAIMKIEEDYRDKLENAAYNLEKEKLSYNDLLRSLDQAKLIAEADGDVVYVDTKKLAGDVVSAYEVLVQVADPKALQLEFTDASKVSDFKRGMKVDVEYENKKYTGEVVKTPADAPLDSSDEEKRSVRIRVDGLPDGIAIGDSAKISLVLERKENVIVIPKNYIKFYANGKKVNIYEDGVRKDRDVVIGIDAGNDVEIVSGLSEGELIIK